MSRWAQIVRQMMVDTASRDVLVVGEGAEELSAALGTRVGVGRDDAGWSADMVVCTERLFALPPGSTAGELDRLARAARKALLIAFPLPADSHRRAAARPLAWWRREVGTRFETAHVRDLGEGEGLALALAPLESRRRESAASGASRPAQDPPPPSIVSFDGDRTGVRVEAHRGAGTSVSRAVPRASVAAGGAEHDALPDRVRDARGGDSGGLRVFIGSEPRSRIAETVLRHSIVCGAGAAHEVFTLDRGACRAGSAWIGDLAGLCWTIPEMCGFEGRALYLDTDAVVLGDIGELARLPRGKAVLAPASGGNAALLIDCSKFRSIEAWPSVQKMRTSRWIGRRAEDLLRAAGEWGVLPAEWYSADGVGFVAGETRLVHYAAAHTRPWRPWPDRISYCAHPVPELEHLWFSWARSAREAGAFGPAHRDARETAPDVPGAGRVVADADAKVPVTVHG
jgi:hypothetical protein